MHNEYEIMMTLTTTLNSDLLTKITNIEKNNFVTDDNLINVAVGIVNEIKKITDYLPSNFYVLNPKLSNYVISIKKYHSSLLDTNLLVNTYKLYDFLKIELTGLKNYLNSINN